MESWGYPARGAASDQQYRNHDDGRQWYGDLGYDPGYDAHWAGREHHRGSYYADEGHRRREQAAWEYNSHRVRASETDHERAERLEVERRRRAEQDEADTRARRNDRYMQELQPRREEDQRPASRDAPPPLSARIAEQPKRNDERITSPTSPAATATASLARRREAVPSQQRIEGSSSVEAVRSPPNGAHERNSSANGRDVVMAARVDERKRPSSSVPRESSPPAHAPRKADAASTVERSGSRNPAPLHTPLPPRNGSASVQRDDESAADKVRRLDEALQKSEERNRKMEAKLSDLFSRLGEVEGVVEGNVKTQSVMRQYIIQLENDVGCLREDASKRFTLVETHADALHTSQTTLIDQVQRLDVRAAQAEASAREARTTSQQQPAVELAKLSAASQTVEPVAAPRPILVDAAVATSDTRPVSEAAVQVSQPVTPPAPQAAPELAQAVVPMAVDEQHVSQAAAPQPAVAEAQTSAPRDSQVAASNAAPPVQAVQEHQALEGMDKAGLFIKRSRTPSDNDDRSAKRARPQEVEATSRTFQEPTSPEQSSPQEQASISNAPVEQVARHSSAQSSPRLDMERSGSGLLGRIQIAPSAKWSDSRTIPRQDKPLAGAESLMILVDTMREVSGNGNAKLSIYTIQRAIEAKDPDLLQRHGMKKWQDFIAFAQRYVNVKIGLWNNAMQGVVSETLTLGNDHRLPYWSKMIMDVPSYYQQVHDLCAMRNQSYTTYLIRAYMLGNKLNVSHEAQQAAFGLPEQLFSLAELLSEDSQGVPGNQAMPRLERRMGKTALQNLLQLVSGDARRLFWHAKMHLKISWGGSDGNTMRLADAAAPFYDDEMNERFLARGTQWANDEDLAEEGEVSAYVAPSLVDAADRAAEDGSPQLQYGSEAGSESSEARAARTAAAALLNRLGAPASASRGKAEELQARMRPKQRTDVEPCFHYTIGKCKYGDKCNKPHIDPPHQQRPRRG